MTRKYPFPFDLSCSSLPSSFAGRACLPAHVFQHSNRWLVSPSHRWRWCRGEDFIFDTISCFACSTVLPLTRNEADGRQATVSVRNLLLLLRENLRNPPLSHNWTLTNLTESYVYSGTRPPSDEANRWHVKKRRTQPAVAWIRCL